MPKIIELCPEAFRLKKPLPTQVVHGESWRQADLVVGYDPETKTVYVTRTFTGEEVLTNIDHFPGWVIMAAVLQQEFAAQATIQYALFDKAYDDCLFTFVKIEATFRYPVPAGTELMAICHLISLPKPGTVNLGTAECVVKMADDKVAMTIKITFKVVQKSKTPLAANATV